MGFADFFIDVELFPYNAYGLFQLIYLIIGYGCVLMYSSNLISDGSELLLLVPEWAGVVGTIVLPVLGAVPDGALVLFSGLGSDAQRQLDIGVGALAGSCIMLLTIPWFLSVLGGRVTIKNGTPNYDGSPKLEQHSAMESLSQTGVVVSPFVKQSARIMLGTACSYFFLQIPAFYYYNKDLKAVAAKEQPYALLGLVVSLVLFFAYLLYQWRVSSLEDSAYVDKRESVVRKAIQEGRVSVLGAMAREYRDWTAADAVASEKSGGEREKLLRTVTTMKRLRNVLRPFFQKYDRDGNDSLEISELSSLLADLGELPTRETIEIFNRFDVDRNGVVDFAEFVCGMTVLLRNLQDRSTGDNVSSVQARRAARSPDGRSRGPSLDGCEGTAEEEEEVPEDLQHLSPEQQQWRIKVRAGWMMALGTVLVLFFSDPMVDALDNLGKRIHVPPFFVAFVLAPLVSNGSELVAAYNYSVKKTRKSISISLTTLAGAICMNNTFCLGIFCLLIYAKGLAWEFSAETLTILLSQVFVGFFAMKATNTLFDAVVVLSVYPLSIALIAVLEASGWN